MESSYTLPLYIIRYSCSIVGLWNDRLTLALQIFKATLDPAQLRISVAKRFGFESSWKNSVSRNMFLMTGTYNLAAIDANDKVIP